MTDKMRRKATMLLIELESLRECPEGTNSIGTHNLLEEILKDANCLAKQAISTFPGTLDERAKAARLRCIEANKRINAASAKGSIAMERSRKFFNLE